MIEAGPKVIQLGEYDPVFLAEPLLTQEFGRRILDTYKKHIAIDWPTPKTNMHWRLCSLGYVGHIPLSEDLALSLTPKTSIGNLFRMLEWAYNLGSFDLFVGDIQSDSLDDIYQMLANILAKRVLDRGRKGLYREYQGRGERLPYLRGRVDMARAMLRPWEANFPCHYEDHNADNEDNRILAWTLYTIARSGVCRGEALSVVRQAFLQLRGATRLEPQLPKSCIGRLYNRLNNDYHPLHALCRFFLEQMGPGHEWGERTMIPFLVNMGRLYELFAARWLAHHLDTGLQLKSQERVRFEKNEAISMNIDLVVEERETGRVLCVMDTKYKVPEQAAEADIYQAVAYAEAKGCEKAFLIYPEPLSHPLNVQIGRIRVKSLCFGLNDDLDKQGQRFMQVLADEIPPPELPRVQHRQASTDRGDNVTFLHAQAWRLLTAIVTRRPDLRIIETHPGGGQYDCLSLYDADQTHVADLNLRGNFHVFNRLTGKDRDAHRFHDWQVLLNSTEELISQALNWVGLSGPAMESDLKPHVRTYSFISLFLRLMADVSNEWQCRNGYFDSSGVDGCYVVDDFDLFQPAKERLSQRLPDDFLRQSAYRFWFIRKSGEPRICLESTGSIWLRNGDCWNIHDIQTEFLPDFAEQVSAKINEYDARLSRARGCLLGQLAGDALGSLVEFQTPEQIRRDYPNGVRELADGGTFNTIAGQPTDDSEMALMLARSLIDRGCFDRDAVTEAYVYWLHSRPFDCGNTIRTGLEDDPNPVSQANGAMMRVSPLGIFGAGYELEKVAEWAQQDAAITHPHPICQQANALYAMAIADAIRSRPEPRELYDRVVSWACEMAVDPSLLSAIQQAEGSPPSDFLHQQGWVLIAFQNALYQLLHAPNPEEGIVDTVMRGGDTDTNAAICGALLGSVYGIEAIPNQWHDAVLSCRPEQGKPGVHQPRPECFWPVDALDLAEKLLDMGDAS